MATKRVYTYRQVADRIEQELGVRPSLSSLRAAAAEERRRGFRDGMPRLTLGLPEPEPRASATSAVLFSYTSIETWLRRHPRRTYQAAVDAVTKNASRSERQLEAAVRQARAARVSWRDIAEGISAGSDLPASRAWTHRRFRHLGEE